MAIVEFIESEVLRVPDVVGDILQIGRTLIDGMLVEAIEAGFVDDIDNRFLGMGDGQRGIGG